MDYKEKYEQALKYMRTVYPTLNGAAKEDVEHHFPELKESEDEEWMKSTFDKLSIGGDMCLGEKCWIQSIKQRIKRE